MECDRKPKFRQPQASHPGKSAGLTVRPHSREPGESRLSTAQKLHFQALYLARPHVRHSEWAEEDHLKSAARFCWWGRRTLPHDGSPSERSEGGGNNDTLPLRSHAARAPPGQALGSRQLAANPLLGA